jgi:hypothetical protein
LARLSKTRNLVSGTSGADEPDLIIRLRLVEPLVRPWPTDPMVVIRSGAESKELDGLMQFYRIGDVPRKLVNDCVIPTSEAFFWRHTDKSGEFTRRKASTWTLRNFDICNPDE